MKKYILALGITSEDLGYLVAATIMACIIVAFTAALGYGVTLIVEPIMGRPMPLEIGAKLVLGTALIVGVCFCAGAWTRRAYANYIIRLNRYTEREKAALPRTKWDATDDAALARLAEQKREQT